jgi:hypothetical protein
MNDSEMMADTFKSGYSSKQVITAVMLAFVLHGSILAGYFVLGSAKKPQGKVAASGDRDKKDGDKNIPAKATGDGKPGEKTDDASKPAETPAKTTPNPDVPKNSDTAKPGDVPKAPDGDIDAILKAK